MASILGKIVRPAALASKQFNRSIYGGSLTRAQFGPNLICRQPAQLMSSASSNYHYHEPPKVHKHDKLWKAERYLSLALLGVLPAAAVMPSPIMDHAVALSLVVHVHWGLEAIATDYIRPSIFGPTIPKVAVALVYVLSSLALGGLWMFNYTDVGITQAVEMLAKL